MIELSAIQKQQLMALRIWMNTNCLHSALLLFNFLSNVFVDTIFIYKISDATTLHTWYRNMYMYIPYILLSLSYMTIVFGSASINKIVVFGIGIYIYRQVRGPFIQPSSYAHGIYSCDHCHSQYIHFMLSCISNISKPQNEILNIIRFDNGAWASHSTLHELWHAL